MMPLIDSNFPQLFLRNLREYRDLHFLCDCLLRIETQQSIQNVDSECPTYEIYAHRLVLAATSSFFKEIFLLRKDQKDPVTTVNLKLHSPNAVNCFKVVLGYLYSGELHLKDCDPQHVFQVAKVCQITALEDQLRPLSPPKPLKQEPVTRAENGHLDVNSTTPPARLNGFCQEHKTMCCPCQNKSNGSIASAYESHLNSIRYSPMPPVSMAYVPAQSRMIGMPTQQAVHHPTVAAAEPMRSYYGALLPTTTNLLPPAPHSVPTYPPPVHQGFSPMIRVPHPHSGSPMSISISNSPTVSMNEHVTRVMEVKREQLTPQKTTAKKGANAKAMRHSPPDAPFDNLGDVIIPSSEKEGWCRNKKYIERVPDGFMCTVCRKVYGRYNSVSYHVTIYHRNPPIKCDEPDCQFTTREARYIHFHKYYRHHIALPESIDLGSRKCPFCRHVSKSPAMLEKHVSRHMPDCNRVGRMYQCPQCPKQLSSQRVMYDHILTHAEDKNYPCDQCSYKGKTESNLTQHVLFKHSSEMFKKKMRCQVEECNFSCVTMEQMQEHKTRVHEIQVYSISHSDDHCTRDDEKVLLIHSDEDEDIDVDGDSESIKMELVSPISATSPQNFPSIVNDNSNFSIGSMLKQPGFSAECNGTSLKDHHNKLAPYSAANELISTQNYVIA